MFPIPLFFHFILRKLEYQMKILKPIIEFELKKGKGEQKIKCTNNIKFGMNLYHLNQHPQCLILLKKRVIYQML